MIKVIVSTIIITLGLITFKWYSLQQPEPPMIFVGGISEYLPITLNDDFELTSMWHYYNYPYGKTEFTGEELQIVYRAIKSFQYYGASHPYVDELFYGVPPFLIAQNDYHKTVISFIYSQWGTIASVLIDDAPEQWFTVDPGAFHELLRLIGWIHSDL